MSIKGIPQRLHIYTSRWPQNTAIEDLMRHVTNITNTTEITVEEVPLQYGSMKAFKVITPFKCFDTMYNVDNWPECVLIKRFSYSNNNNAKRTQENPLKGNELMET